MKHLKSLLKSIENNQHEFIGDYAYAGTLNEEGITREFMKNHIGKIIQYWGPTNRFRVKYLNAPAGVELNADLSYWFDADEIIYHSKDEQDCLDKLEMLIQTNKYNI